MLEFIVLGQIPGTGFVITFSWVVAAATVLGGISLLRYEHRHQNILQQVKIEETSI